MIHFVPFYRVFLAALARRFVAASGCNVFYIEEKSRLLIYCRATSGCRCVRAWNQWFRVFFYARYIKAGGCICVAEKAVSQMMLTTITDCVYPCFTHFSLLLLIRIFSFFAFCDENCSSALRRVFPSFAVTNIWNNENGRRLFAAHRVVFMSSWESFFVVAVADVEFLLLCQRASLHENEKSSNTHIHTTTYRYKCMNHHRNHRRRLAWTVIITIQLPTTMTAATTTTTTPTVAAAAAPNWALCLARVRDRRVQCMRASSASLIGAHISRDVWMKNSSKWKRI